MLCATLVQPAQRDAGGKQLTWDQLCAMHYGAGCKGIGMLLEWQEQHCPGAGRKIGTQGCENEKGRACTTTAKQSINKDLTSALRQLRDAEGRNHCLPPTFLPMAAQPQRFASSPCLKGQ